MKTIRYNVVMLLAVLFLSAAVYAQERTKTVNKAYKVGETVELSLDNKYGSIHVETWERGEITVDITIRADMRNESRAQDLLDKVSIDISESSSDLEFRTRISGNINTRSGEDFSIDYEVNMPVGNPLTVRMGYGDVYLDDLEGQLSLDLRYGNIKGDALTGDFDIELAYSNGEIDELGSGALDLAYSNLTVDRMQDTDLKSRYSNINMEEAGDLDVDMRYGNVRTRQLNSINVDARYSGVEIGYLARSLYADLQYGGGIKVEQISRNFTSIEVDAGYAGTELTFERGTNANIEGYFRYGSLKFDERDIEFSKIIKENNSSEYMGKMGNGGSTVKLEGSYGSARIRVE